MSNSLFEVEGIVVKKIADLIAEGERLSAADTTSDSSTGRLNRSTSKQYAQICGWLTSVLNLIDLVFSNKNNHYMDQIKKHEAKILSEAYIAYTYAGIVTQILKSFQADLGEGFFRSLQDLYTAESFDDFLGHAEEYYNQNKKMESGVISGVVFEDTIRKIAIKFDIEEKDQKLENLINALKAKNIIQKTKASSCKTAAAVRGTATHANWDELDIGSVRDTISLTRELIGEFLES